MCSRSNRCRYNILIFSVLKHQPKRSIVQMCLLTQGQFKAHLSVLIIIVIGIQMESVPLSTSIVFSASNSTFLLDPILEEEETMESLLIFVTAPSSSNPDTENIVNSICTGPSLSTENLLFAADLSSQIASAMRQFIRDLISAEE